MYHYVVQALLFCSRSMEPDDQSGYTRSYFQFTRRDLCSAVDILYCYYPISGVSGFAPPFFFVTTRWKWLNLPKNKCHRCMQYRLVNLSIFNLNVSFMLLLRFFIDQHVCKGVEMY